MPIVQHLCPQRHKHKGDLLTGSESKALVIGVERAYVALRDARNDFERLIVRDKAQAIVAAAEVLKRRDIQTEASILVAYAERAIAAANPPQKAGRPKAGKESVIPDHGLSRDSIRQIRQAHDKLTDEQFAAASGKAREQGEPLTRTALIPEPQIRGRLQLYPHQAAGIEATRSAARAGHKRQILCAPTGSGKTECAIYLLDEARKRGSRVAFVVDSIPLVRQTHNRLSLYGIPHGIAQGRKNTRSSGEKVQVWSAQTAEARNLIKRGIDLVIFDECHVQREKLMRQAAEDDIHVLGLTATPLTKRLGDYCSHVTNVVTTDWLLNNVNPQTEQPYLAPLRIYSGVATTEIDMEGAALGSDGEYTARAVRERGGVVIGDVVKEWDRMCFEHFGRWVKTLVFSADVAHGEELCTAFQAIGADARQSTYRDSEEETTRLVEDFSATKFDVLVSVCKFIKGFDDPTVMCVVDVRKNRTSLSEVIQKMGRAMRYAPGKEYALYLDHVRNMEDWYYRILDVWENGVSVLHKGKDKKPRPKQTSRENRPDVTCYGCGLVLLPGMDMCPACGRIRSRRTTEAVTVEGTLREFRQAKPTEWMKDESWVWSQLSRLALERKGGDVEAAQRSASGYYKGMYGGWPSWGRPLVPCEGPVDEGVINRVTYNLIRYQHSQKRRNGT